MHAHPAGLTGARIVTTRLCATRAANVTRLRRRKGSLCGPYTWTVPEPKRHEGRGFYFASGSSGGLAMDRSGAMFDMPIQEANDVLRGTRLAMTTGYYADEYGDSTIIPYVVTLPKGRGFLPAYGEGPGMWGTVEYDIHATAEDAARAAHDLAERAAEREREWRAAEDARLAAEEREIEANEED